MKDNQYKLMLSYVAKDKPIALLLATHFNGLQFTFSGKTINISLTYMDNPQAPCTGDFGKWSEGAVLSSDGVLAIVSSNTVEKIVDAQGNEFNQKIVYDELSLAKKNNKDIILLRQQQVVLAEGYDLLLQRISYSSFENTLDEAIIKELITSIEKHVEWRLSGNPLLEYAGVMETELKSSPYADVSVFVGREKELQQIDDAFDNGKKVVCLVGFGGMGKTTLAKMYASKHKEKPLCLCTCSESEESLKNAIISLAVENDVPDFVKLDREEQFAIRLKQLKKLKNRTIIVIDNFNADFNNSENRSVLQTMSTLEKCEFIISSRSTLARKDVEIIEVVSLSEEQLTTIFIRDSGCEENGQNLNSIKEIIRLTGGHTMTVVLAAKAMARRINRLTPQILVKEFLSLDKKTRLEDDARADGYDEYDTIYSHLRKLFALSRLDATHHLLLGSLSFVCALGISYEQLFSCCPQTEQAAEELLCLGLLQENQDAVFLHPLISELSFIDFVPSSKDYEQIIKLVLKDKADWKISNDTRQQLENKTDYALHIANRLQRMLQSDSSVQRYLAISYQNLGVFYMAQGNIQKAEQYHLLSLELRKEIAQQSDTIEAKRDLSVSYERLGGIYEAQGNIQKAEQYYLLSFELFKEIAQQSDTIDAKRALSISYGRLGDTYIAQGNIDKAEQYYLLSFELFKEIAQQSDTIDAKRDLSIIYERLGDIYMAQGNIQKAEQYYLLSLELRKEIAQQSDTIDAKRALSVSYEKLGGIYKAQGNIQKAEQYYLLSFELFKEIAQQSDTIEAKRALSVSYEKLGGIYEAQGNIQKAEQYYLLSLELRKEIAQQSDTIEAKRDLSVSYNKLGYIYEVQGNIQKAEQYYLLSFELRKEIALKTETLQAYDDLICSYALIGLLKKGKEQIEYFEQAIAIAQMIYAQLGRDYNGRYLYLAECLLSFGVDQTRENQLRKIIAMLKGN